MLRILLTFIVSLLFMSCGDNPVASPPRDLTELEKQLVTADNKFGLKLFQEVAKDDHDKNVFISPFSVSMALGMVLNGADGETKAAMQRTLEVAGLSDEQINTSYQSLIQLLRNLDPRVTFRIANSIWYRQGMTFEPDFINTNRTYFDAEVDVLDFGSTEAVDIINDWVADNTNGKIEKIVDQIDPEIVMFLINAIYFKGDWTQKFDASLTDNGPFRVPGATEKQVRMMHIEDTFRYLETEQLQAVDMTYGDSLYSMTVILPKPQQSLQALIAELNQSNLLERSDGFSTQIVNLTMPKFKLEYEISLKEVLSRLGMGVAFDPSQADLTRMYTGPNNAYISKVKHKTFVEVDEKGTEAAAATSVEVGVVSVPPVFEMTVDRPFLFLIREHHSGTILFIGKILDPTRQKN